MMIGAQDGRKVVRCCHWLAAGHAGAYLVALQQPRIVHRSSSLDTSSGQQNPRVTSTNYLGCGDRPYQTATLTSVAVVKSP
jgi:hypothetical protein